MKKHSITTIVSVIGGIAFLGALFYFGGRNRPSTPVVNTAIDPHGHNTTANVSSNPSLNDLVGKPAPAFSLADRDGTLYSLESLRDKNVILFFNEGLMCYPSCWNQIVSLSKDSRFNSEDTVVLSVVVDPPQDWQKAIDKMPELAQATVAFDQGGTVAEQYGMLITASSMHYGQLPGHTYVVIDKGGIVRYVFDDPNMGIRNDQLVAEIAELSRSSAGDTP